MNPNCARADEHPLMLSCACGYLSRSVSQLVADARGRGYADGAADAFDRIGERLPRSGEYVGSCCEHCAALQDLLKAWVMVHRKPPRRRPDGTDWSVKS